MAITRTLIPTISNTFQLQQQLNTALDDVYDAIDALPTTTHANTWTADQTINAKLGIGVTPSSFLDVFAAADSTPGRFGSAVGLGAGSGGFTANATTLIPTAVNQRLGGTFMGAQNGAANVNSAAVVAFSEEAWTFGAAQGTYLTFATTQPTTATRTEKMRITGAGRVGIGITAPATLLDVNGAVRTAPTTVAGLTAPAAGLAGAKWFVTDANATTFASIVAGGGANGVPVYCDGTNWRIG